jgi:hypothetical protein
MLGPILQQFTTRIYFYQDLSTGPFTFNKERHIITLLLIYPQNARVPVTSRKQFLSGTLKGRCVDPDETEFYCPAETVLPERM